MIPVEQYAAGTARIAADAEELAGLDVAWRVLEREFTRTASRVELTHASSHAAGENLTKLSELDCNLLAVERRAVEIMADLSALLLEIGRG